MSRIAIIDSTTGAILVLDPPTDVEGKPICPEGIDCSVVTLTDTEAATLNTPNSRFLVSGDGAVVAEDVPAAADPSAADLAAIAKEAKRNGAFAALARAVGVSVPH